MSYLIQGLAETEDFLNLNGDCPYRELHLEAEGKLKDSLPDINKIFQISGGTLIHEYKLLHKSPYPKIIITGQVNLQLLYSTSDSFQSIHTEVFMKNFQTFIPLQHFQNQWDSIKPKILIENITFHLVHCRKFQAYLLLFLYLPVS